MNIVLIDNLEIPEGKMAEYVSELEKMGHSFKAYPKTTDNGENLNRIKEADVVITANSPVTDDMIRECPNLKYIDVAFTGLDHVGLKEAKERDIVVSNAAGYSTESVAELAIAMMITLLRDLKKADSQVRDLKGRAGLKATLLQGKTVGIVGVGAIGERVAQILNVFRCEILGHKRHVTGKEPDYIKFVDLPTLLESSDIVTLHCPLTTETRGMLDDEMIGKMKDGAILINTARGPVVDTKALAKALKEGKLGGAGIDVYDTEPPLGGDNPLLDAPNTVLTPHIGYVSEESMLERAEIVFDKLNKFLDGEAESIDITKSL